jgi:hypothetical protein
MEPGPMGKTRPLSAVCVLLGFTFLHLSFSLSAAPPRLEVRTDGAIVADGRPFFPVGFYHVSWGKDRMGDDARADFRAIAAGGFDFLHPTIDLRPGCAETLDLAAREGMWVIPEVNARVLERVIARHRDAPAILAWNVGDDVTGEASVEEVRKRCERVKALSPRHLTYASAYNSGEKWIGKPGAEAWFGAGVDLLGMQSYPVPWAPEHGRHGGFDYAPGPHAKGNFRARVYYGMRRTVDQARAAGKHGVIANLQCFRWNREGEKWRWPTPDELENMTWQAVAAGVNGILYYTYYDESTFVPDRPAIWGRVKRIRTDLETLEPVLVGGTRTLGPAPEEPGRNVFWSCWKHGNALTVIAVNVSPSRDPEPVSIDLPEGVGGTYVPALKGRPVCLKLEGRRLTGAIPFEGVEVGRILLKP